ncbi:hypothetical protein [Aurantiacibacter poecillastricola]|uniref:hypothetical protein n=1 Tax=Aurantiacibacter poecillastricola TaxID=3064385 RepID=UPI00273D3364|nr:hypothetical protein [Aurantiacibacter sp. 219JJ12-13]MDP5260496.1 hypothetical protein [Aurantiacibacter sp. 219JJ12-13]
MYNRYVFGLAAVASNALAFPACAQQDHISAQAVDIPDTVGEWEHGWHGDASSQPAVDTDLGTWLGYSFAEREAWLADCRLLMADAGGYRDYGDLQDNDADGGLIGGLTGAVIGGVAGNRIADGQRLGGTLIGLGLGGLAGAAIGTLIDDADDDEEASIRDFDANALWAARYCDAYLTRYEIAGGARYVARDAAHGERGHSHGPDCTITVRDEWFDEEPAMPSPPARRAIPPRLEPDGKAVPLG